jgi:alcohol dehydrogenase class IV
VLEANLRASEPGSPVWVKFRELAGLLTGDPGADTQDGLRWVHDLVTDLQVPGLRRYGLSAADLDLIAERGLAASSMKANPVTFNQAALVAILVKAM